MLIHIAYLDNSHDLVKALVLDGMIEANGIIKFKRTTGWVTIGRDSVRKMRDGMMGNAGQRIHN